MAENEFYLGTGRRKTAVARVRMRLGSGTIIVNGKPYDEYFPVLQHRQDVTAPLAATGMEQKYDIHVRVGGGGPTGQAGAIRLGVARALRRCDENFEHTLREHGFMTRDPRMKERKKYGQAGARKRFQFSKR